MLVEIKRNQMPSVFTNIPKRMFNSRKFETGPILMKDFNFTDPQVDVPMYNPEERVSVCPVEIALRGAFNK